MSESRRSSDEFRVLLDAACENSLTPDQVQRLESILRRDDEARQQYEEYLQLNMELYFTARARRAEAATPARREQKRARQPAAGYWGSAVELMWRPRALAYASVAALILLLLAAVGLRPWMPGGQAPAAETVAKLTRAAGVEWSDEHEAPAVGDSLAAGRRLELSKGVAEIRLNDGAKVSLAGPASLQVNAAMAVKLFSGRLTANVPVSAVGFRVDTPSARVIDKGTSFGVNVAGDGDGEIHVFEGQVDAFLRGGSVHSYDKQLLLLAGQAAQFASGRSSVHLGGARSAAFPPSLRQYLEDEIEQDVVPQRQYVLSQSFLEGPAPGTFRIEDEEIDLRAGRKNTVCVMLDEPQLMSGFGQRVQVIAPPLKDIYDGVFLMCSTVLEQPDGVASFGLRLRRDTRGMWAMTAADPEWRDVLSSAQRAVHILPDPGGPLVLSIERVSATAFRCYYQEVGGETEPVLIEEVEVPPLASHEKLYVGVQAWCNDKLHNYRFSQLQVVPTEGPAAVQER